MDAGPHPTRGGFRTRGGVRGSGVRTSTRGGVRMTTVGLVLMAGLTLSGCTVTGTVTYLSDRIDVDAMVTTQAASCPQIGSPFRVIEMDRATERVTCQYTGSLGYNDHDGGSWQFGQRSGDEVVVILPPFANASWNGDALTGLDLTLQFPGPTRALTDTPVGWGRSVHLDETTLTRGVVMIGSLTPAPSLTEILAAAGLAVGATGGVLLGRRARVPGHPPRAADAEAADGEAEAADGEEPTDEEPTEPTEPPPTRTATEREDPSVWGPGR